MQPKKPNTTDNNAWHNSTLRAVASNPTVSTDPDYPVAPPRRKRSSLALSTILVPDENKPGGFKEVFGDLLKQRHCSSDNSLNKSSYSIDDFTDFSKDLSNESTSTANENDIRSLKRRISKVGNKKSDKFFGENLSDCLSDEPITSESPILSEKMDEKCQQSSGYESQVCDALDAFVEKNVSSSSEEYSTNQSTLSSMQPTSEQRKHFKMTDEPPPPPLPVQTEPKSIDEPQSLPTSNDKRSSMDKRAEFLMTLLEGYNKDTESIVSSNAEQPDATIVAPKRKQTKGIKENHTSSQQDDGLSSVDDIEKQIRPVESISSAPKSEKRVYFAFQEKTEKHPESIDETDFYANMKPVEEPVIVPKRKVYKHICHDDEHMHDIMHTDVSTEVHAVNATNTSIDTVSPKKPARDFTKYGKSQTLPNGIIKNMYTTSEPIEKPIRRNRKNVSRDNLPTPPPAPARTVKCTADAIVHATNDAVINATKSNGSNELSTVDRPLRKCASSQSFLTNDVMADIVNKVYDFDVGWECDDGSADFIPMSKVATRKISATRLEREKSIELAATNPFKYAEVNGTIQAEEQVTQTTSIDAVEQKEIEKLAEFSIGGATVSAASKLDETTAAINDFLMSERTFSMDSPVRKPLNDNRELNSSDESIPSTVDTVILNPLKADESSVSATNTGAKLVSWSTEDELAKCNAVTGEIIGEQHGRRRASENTPAMQYEQSLTVPRRSLDSCDRLQLAKVFIVPEIKITTEPEDGADHSVLLKFFKDDAI